MTPENVDRMQRAYQELSRERDRLERENVGLRSLVDRLGGDAIRAGHPDIVDAIDAWARDCWPDADKLSKCRKLVEEAGEVSEAVARIDVECAQEYPDAHELELLTQDARAEIGDVGIALKHLLFMLDPGVSLESVIAQRWEVVMHRKLGARGRLEKEGDQRDR